MGSNIFFEDFKSNAFRYGSTIYSTSKVEKNSDFSDIGHSYREGKLSKNIFLLKSWNLYLKIYQL